MQYSNRVFTKEYDSIYQQTLVLADEVITLEGDGPQCSLELDITSVSGYTVQISFKILRA
jgi:hypothetical protein